MFNLNLDRAVDLSTGAFVGFLTVSGLMTSLRCPRQERICTPDSSIESSSDYACVSNTCPVSPCSRTNLRLAVGAGFLTSGLYLYRGLR